MLGAKRGLFAKVSSCQGNNSTHQVQFGASYRSAELYSAGNARSGVAPKKHLHPMRSLLIVLTLPLLVFAAAIVAYQFGWFSGGQKNNGVLLADPQQLSPEQLQLLGSVEPESEKWRLLMVRARCDAACSEDLAQLRTVHDLVGGTSLRVERWLVVADSSTLDVAELQEQQPYLRIFSMDAAIQSQLLANAEQALYIVDPLGNVILSYSREQLGKPLLQDLKHLIKMSRIG